METAMLNSHHGRRRVYTQTEIDALVPVTFGVGSLERDDGAIFWCDGISFKLTANVFFIDPDAVTDGVGTLETPYNTWNNVTFEEGKTYLQKSGTTWAGHLTINARKVTVGVYGGSAKALINGAGQYRCITIGVGADDVTVDNFELYGANDRTNGTVRGIGVGSNSTNRADNFKMTRCVIRDISYLTPTDDVNGISAFSNNCIIDDTEIYNIGSDGIWLSGLAPKIRRVYIHDIAQDGRLTGDCIQFSGDASNYEISDSILDHSNTECKQAFIDGGVGSNGIIRNSILIMGTDGAAADTKTLNMQVANSKAVNVKIVNGYHCAWINGGSQILNSEIVGHTTTDRGATMAGADCKIKNTSISSCINGVRVEAAGTGSEITHVDFRDISNNGIICFIADFLTTGGGIVHSNTYTNIAVNETTSFSNIDLMRKTSSPTVNDDNTKGFVVGSRWINTTAGTAFICVNTTTGAAVWV